MEHDILKLKLGPERADLVWNHISLLLGYYIIGSVIGLISYAIRYTCPPKPSPGRPQPSVTISIGKMVLLLTLIYTVLSLAGKQSDALAFHVFMPKVAPFLWPPVGEGWRNLVVNNWLCAFFGCIMPPPRAGPMHKRASLWERVFEFAGRAGFVLIMAMPMQIPLQWAASTTWKGYGEK